MRNLFSPLANVIRFHLKTEVDYIFPEVLGTTELVKRHVDKALNDQKSIKKLMSNLEKLVLAKPQTSREKIIDSTVSLSQKLEEHFQNEEENMMPRIRDKISTDDREDLGQLIQDLKADGEIEGCEELIDELISSESETTHSPALQMAQA